MSSSHCLCSTSHRLENLRVVHGEDRGFNVGSAIEKAGGQDGAASLLADLSLDCCFTGGFVELDQPHPCFKPFPSPPKLGHFVQLQLASCFIHQGSLRGGWESAIELAKAFDIGKTLQQSNCCLKVDPYCDNKRSSQLWVDVLLFANNFRDH